MEYRSEIGHALLQWYSIPNMRRIMRKKKNVVLCRSIDDVSPESHWLDHIEPTMGF